LNHLLPHSQAFGGGRVDAPHGVAQGACLGDARALSMAAA
jgi:hypothetical protein